MPNPLDIGPLTGVGTIFVTIAANVICWSIISRLKSDEGTRKKVNGHETDIAVLYDHLKLTRPVLR